MSFLFSGVNEIICKIRRRFGVFVVVVGLLICGIVVGLAISKKDCTCWWCQGRITCIKFVQFKGFFTVFFRFFLNLLILFVLLCLTSLNCVTNYLKTLFAFFIGLFVGSYFALLVGMYSFAGVLCGVFVFALLGVGCCIAVVVSFINAENRCSPSLKDVVRLNLQSLYLILATFVCVLVALFLVVRPFVVVL